MEKGTKQREQTCSGPEIRTSWVYLRNRNRGTWESKQRVGGQWHWKDRQGSEDREPCRPHSGVSILLEEPHGAISVLRTCYAPSHTQGLCTGWSFPLSQTLFLLFTNLWLVTDLTHHLSQGSLPYLPITVSCIKDTDIDHIFINTYLLGQLFSASLAEL